MVIQHSSSAQTTRLVQDLLGEDAVRREAAIARLAIAGERAVDRLLSALPQTSPAGQVAVLRALELIASPRALPAAVLLLQDPDDAAAAAATASSESCSSDTAAGSARGEAISSSARSTATCPAGDVCVKALNSRSTARSPTIANRAIAASRRTASSPRRSWTNRVV